ncbi:MAG: threonylcarbamoyl-AMP synthase [Planctomycetaceae bacterium]|jgi:protein-tyrosine phosphatase|nr:threonylcarbamoyl-AMP synthase [Planctomycetaceae bacterium]
MPFERLSSSNIENTANKAVAALRKGQIIVFPTETVYGLAVRASDEAAVQRLSRLKNRSENHPFMLAFSKIEPLDDFVPDMEPLALRLIRRCLPGPVSLVLDIPPRDSDFYLLPPTVQNAVSRIIPPTDTASQTKTVCFRVPNHPFALKVLAQLDEPIILTSANRTGQSEKSTVDEIITELGSGIDLIVDDGVRSETKPSTIIRVSAGRYSILREGVLKRETLERLTARMILFVCTGNTCRSPMAERICENLIAKRFCCSLDQLEEHGFVVLSAGVSVGGVSSASPQAIEVLRSKGLDLTDHRSQQLNETHIRFADHIFAMTRNHRATILSFWPRADMRLNVLRTDGGDISDPFGCSDKIYADCAQQLELEIGKRLDEIL